MTLGFGRPGLRLPIVAALALAALSSPAAAAAPTPQALEDFARYAEAARRDWRIPGLAIAIVAHDRVVLERGFGERDLDNGGPVGAHTVFAIGSSTKAFTAALVATLVDDGRLDWDDRVAELLPGFELYDPYATRELRLRDLLCHRSGLPRGDRLWFGSGFTRSEILRRVRFLEPSWSFRSTFGYQNVMYLAAGELAARLAGAEWDELIQDRFFDPLGMERSSTSVDALAGMDDVAVPHAMVDGEVTAIRWRDLDNVAPAGSINSSVHDMAQWLRLQLGSGEVDGRRLLSAESVAEMQRPQMLINRDQRLQRFLADAHFLTYGLGWFVSDYRGHKVVQHGGSIDGMRAIVGLVPEIGFGIVVLSNLSPNEVRRALLFRAIDMALGAPARDWNAEVLTEQRQELADSAAERDRLRGARLAGTRPALPLATYAGSYGSALYGDAVVELVDGGLVLRSGDAFVGDLRHWHRDTFEAAWRDAVLGRSMITFAIDSQAAVVGFDWEGCCEYGREKEPAASAP